MALEQREEKRDLCPASSQPKETNLISLKVANATIFNSFTMNFFVNSLKSITFRSLLPKVNPCATSAFAKLKHYCVRQSFTCQ